MSRLPQISRMFEEIGLGTEQERNKFNNIDLTQNGDKEEIVFIKYSNTTKSEEEENA